MSQTDRLVHERRLLKLRLPGYKRTKYGRQATCTRGVAEAASGQVDLSPEPDLPGDENMQHATRLHGTNGPSYTLRGMSMVCI